VASNIRQTLPESASVTMMLPSESIAIPRGEQKAAVMPRPSNDWATPLPATREFHSCTSHLNLNQLCH